MNALDKHMKLPANCDLSTIGPLHMAVLYDEAKPDQLFSDSTYCGMDTDQEVAMLKALVECSERHAFREGILRQDPLCLTKRSDGIAAFPVGKSGRREALDRARRNALAEAVERFVWATWWDDHHTAYQTEDLHASATSNIKSLMTAVESLTEIRRWWRITPRISSDLEMAIVFAETGSGGVISGGACGDRQDETIFLRGLSELARHACTANRINKGARPASFYERRLAFMISNAGRASFYQRLETSGENEIIFPKLRIDSEIDHELRDAVAVHRCLFENQPPFVGGALERLCL